MRLEANGVPHKGIKVTESLEMSFCDLLKSLLEALVDSAKAFHCMLQPCRLEVAHELHLDSVRNVVR